MDENNKNQSVDNSGNPYVNDENDAVIVDEIKDDYSSPDANTSDKVGPDAYWRISKESEYYGRDGYETSENSAYTASNSQADYSSDKKRKRSKKSTVKNPVFLLLLTVTLGLSIGIGSQLSGIAGSIGDFFSGSDKSNPTASDIVLPADNGAKLVSTKEYELVNIVEKASPSIVAITSKVLQSDFFNNSVQQSGAGSGVICSESNEYIYIVTNNHVVENSSELTVQFSTDSKSSAKVIGADSASDLAVVRVLKSSLDKNTLKSAKPIAIGSSSNLKVGQDAVAIGNALGIGISVTSGVVSALDRNLSESGIENMIQTSAAINPGNSGGALINSSGELIGINSVKISSTSVEGVGFAIPIDTALPIINELVKKGKISRPTLGIYGREVENFEHEYHGVPNGIIIKDTVPGSGAQNAGLQPGDIIFEIDGLKINNMHDLYKILTNRKFGDVLNAKIFRNGKTISVSITLIEKNL